MVVIVELTSKTKILNMSSKNGHSQKWLAEILTTMFIIWLSEKINLNVSPYNGPPSSRNGEG